MAGLLEHVMINKLGDDLDEAITFVGGDTSNVSHISEYPKVIKEQLTKGTSSTIHEIIIPEESKLIISSNAGTDSYSTDYSTGVKSGLKPNTQYLRLCMALVGKEPVYIDMSTLDNLNEDDIMNIVLSSTEYNNIISELNSMKSSIDNLDKDIQSLELKEVIVDEDNYIIIADSQGRDYYNTRYASGIKTGLEPGSMYIRICTAVKNIEPIYISLDTLIKNLPTGEGGDVNINEIVNEVLNSSIFNTKLENKVEGVIDDTISEVTAEVNKLDKHVSDLDNNVNFLASSISSFDDRIEFTETQMETLKTNVEGYDNRISTAESKVLNIEESTEILTTKIGDVEEDLKEQSNLIQNNTSDIIMVKETTSALTTTVNDFDERIVVIENVLNNTNDEGLNEEETDEFFK